MNQLDTITVHDPSKPGGARKAITPALVSSQQPEQASPIRQTGEHIPMVLVQPAIEGPVANAFYGLEQADSSDLTGPRIGLGMSGQLPSGGALHKKLSDKILGSHVMLLGWFHHQYLAGTAWLFQLFLKTCTRSQ
jgi:hypothetical protein